MSRVTSGWSWKIFSALRAGIAPPTGRRWSGFPGPENLKTIQAQWSEVKGIREVPGSYMTSRFVDFAFRDAVSSGVDPDEALRDAVKQMNAEIKLRRKEFGLAEE